MFDLVFEQEVISIKSEAVLGYETARKIAWLFCALSKACHFLKKTFVSITAH